MKFFIRVFLCMFLTSFLNFSALAKKEEITLARIKLFNDMISIKVPTSFTVMHDHEVKKMYPLNDLPKIVHANEDKSICLALNHNKIASEQFTVSAYKDKFLKDFKNIDPKLKEIENGSITVDGRDMAFLGVLFKVPEKKYRFVFFTEFKGVLLSGELVSPKKGYKSWVEIGVEIMNSFQIIQK